MKEDQQLRRNWAADSVNSAMLQQGATGPFLPRRTAGSAANVAL